MFRVFYAGGVVTIFGTGSAVAIAIVVIQGIAAAQQPLQYMLIRSYGGLLR